MLLSQIFLRFLENVAAKHDFEALRRKNPRIPTIDNRLTSLSGKPETAYYNRQI
jgi:hypothetical protein